MKSPMVGVFWGLVLVMSSCSSSRYSGPRSNHFDGTRFVSPYGAEPKGLWSLLKWQLQSEKVPWPKSLETKVHAPWPAQIPSDTIAVTFVNHATILLQYSDFNILTDPVWSERVSPVSFAGPKRFRKPGVAIESLPAIHLVLISHNHYDHLDLETIRELVRLHNPIFLIPLGDGPLLKGISGIRFHEMDWFSVYEFKGHRLTFLPAQHWSARSLFDRNQSLWGSFMVEPSSGPRVYFGGDSGYARHFQEIGEKFPGIDLAFLPIGAYEPRWFMKDQHMNPEDAVRAHRDLGARQSMGIHFGTWQMTDEGYDEPVRELGKQLRKAGLGDQDFFTLEEGETRLVKK